MSSSSSSESLGDDRFSQTSSNNGVVTNVNVSTTATTTMKYLSEGEQAWIQLRRAWTTKERRSEHQQHGASTVMMLTTTTTTTTTTTMVGRRNEAHQQQQQQQHGVQRSINGAAALEDFNQETVSSSRNLRERLPLADIVSILHDLWQEDGTTL
jgi:hypothetical protein